MYLKKWVCSSLTPVTGVLSLPPYRTLSALSLLVKRRVPGGFGDFDLLTERERERERRETPTFGSLHVFDRSSDRLASMFGQVSGSLPFLLLSSQIWHWTRVIDYDEMRKGPNGQSVQLLSASHPIPSRFP